MAKYVGPTGPTDSPVLAIVGEAPGKEEEAQGLPFVGAAGHLLTQMLDSCGISRRECYITNVAKTRPANNDFSHFYTDSKRSAPTTELCNFRRDLHQEMKDVKPKVIVAMGNEALKALTAESWSIKKYRGAIIEKYGYRIIPTYHPAYVLRVYSDRPIVELDLRKAYRQAIAPSTPEMRLQPDPSLAAIQHFFARCDGGDFPRLSVDIETINLYTRCIGFAWSISEAISIPLVSKGQPAWTEATEVEILLGIQRILLNPKIEKVFQNGPFDLTILGRELGLHCEGYVFDTMFAYHLLYPEFPKSLDFLSSVYTDHPHYSDYFAGSDYSTQEYNCMDCCVTYQAATEIQHELVERDMLGFYQRVIHPVVLSLTRMQNKGVLIDVTLRAEIDTKTEKELEEKLTKVRKLTWPEFNPSSPKQVKQLVYDHLQLPKQHKPRTQTVTSDGDALATLARRFPGHAAVLDGITDYRETRTFLSTFVRAKVTRDNRIKTSYNAAGTVTGRISSSQTIDGYGGNLQNIPRGTFRRTYIPDSGNVWIKADLAQAEYRYLVWLARIDRLINSFLHDPDFSIHYWNASNIYGRPREEITKVQYSNAKNGVYGANYGIGAMKVSRMYNMTFQESKNIIDQYHMHVPEIQSVFQREIREKILATRMLRNPFGRERIFFGRVDDDMFRKAYSHACQSTIADLIDAALVELDEKGVDLLLQVHDEIDAQCEDNPQVIAATCAVIKTAMERPIQVPGVDEPLIIPVEIQIGKNWCDVEDYELSPELL